MPLFAFLPVFLIFLLTAQASPILSNPPVDLPKELGHTLHVRQNATGNVTTLAVPTVEVSISSQIQIHDDEPFPFGSENIIRSRTLPDVFLGGNQGFVKQVSFFERGGGEICVQVALTLTLIPANLSVRVDYVLNLFEGVTENCNDLDGTVSGNWLVRKNDAAFIRASVLNVDEGGDRADLFLTIVNTVLG